MPAKQWRSFVFTFNNYTPEQVEQVKALSTKSRYLVFGYEVGESGTPHLQGYCQLQQKMSASKVGGMFPWHTEPTRGTPAEAAAYCKKTGKFDEFGTLSDVGSGGVVGGEKEKARWANVIELAKKGELDTIAENDPQAYVHAYRTLKEIAKDHMQRPPSEEETTGYWIYGPSGVGKSRSVREHFPANTLYEKMCNKWWDGYQNEENVVIDDLDPDHKVLGHHLKIWADHYPFIAETKGGAMRIRPKRIIVTSQYSIDAIFESVETREALHRRFRVFHMLDKTLGLTSFI